MDKTARRGRPLEDPERPKVCSLTIRLSIDDRAVIKEAAGGRISDWARAALVEAARALIRRRVEATPTGKRKTPTP
jgi:uncharacterized protein (DUF1778 family)